MIIRNRAKLLARKRYGDAYVKMMTSPVGKYGCWNDWKFIWSNRTFFGARRSWVQRLIRW